MVPLLEDGTVVLAKRQRRPQDGNPGAVSFGALPWRYSLGLPFALTSLLRVAPPWSAAARTRTAFIAKSFARKPRPACPVGASFFSSRTSSSDESGTPPQSCAPPARKLLLREGDSVALARNLNEACQAISRAKALHSSIVVGRLELVSMKRGLVRAAISRPNALRSLMQSSVGSFSALASAKLSYSGSFFWPFLSTDRV